MGQVSHIVKTLPVSVADELKALGNAVRAQRVARKETQSALAQRLGVSQRTLRDIEKGTPTASVGVVFSVIWALGLRVDVRDQVTGRQVDVTGATKVGRPQVRHAGGPDDF